MYLIMRLTADAFVAGGCARRLALAKWQYLALPLEQRTELTDDGPNMCSHIRMYADIYVMSGLTFYVKTTVSSHTGLALACARFVVTCLHLVCF